MLQYLKPPLRPPSKPPRMMKELGVVLLLCLQLSVCIVLGSLNYEGFGPSSVGTTARVVKTEERTLVFATEFGSISGVGIDDGTGRHEYHLQFITMEPNSLFLPVLLHTDMVFYVQTGSGRLSWTEGDETNKISLQRGDVYRLKSGTVFYVHSSLEPARPRFRIVAMFANPDEEQSQGPSFGPYSSISDLVRGFDKPVLQAAFQVSEEVIEEITSTTDTPAIVHSDQGSRKGFWEDEILFINALFGIQRSSKLGTDNKKKHTKTFNFFNENPDFKSCNGWSKVVTKHDLKALDGSQIGVFMVNLTKGSIMGPHWNPAATEVSIVIEGEGMVQVVCPSALTSKGCKHTRIRVEEGDVFTVPRFHPMAQTSFNNGSLVFMGFSTTSKKNHPQFLAGKASVLQTLDKGILGTSFNVSNMTIGQLLAAQEDSIILDCTSCAEEQEMVMEAEIERERREEERKREEEEARRREEEKRKREEEEARRREEEEKRKREEEEARRREEEEKEREREKEEQRKREEERQRREEEEKERQREKEEQRRREEEEQRRREEEEQRKREKEEEQRRREEEEEQRRSEEEEQRRREDEEQKRREEEEEQRRREEEEEQRRHEQDEQRQREEDEEQKRHEEEEEQRRREEEEEQRRHEQDEQRQREEEEEQRRREQDERRQREEEEQRQREKEEERRQREQEEQRQREKEEEQRQREQEEQKQREKEEEQRQREEEEQRRREEEEKRKRQEEEEMQQEEEQRQQEKRREEERQRQEEEQAEEKRRQEEEKMRQEEEQRRQQEERGRGEEESEGDMARREEEERVKREREAEGGGRWKTIQLYY